MKNKQFLLAIWILFFAASLSAQEKERPSFKLGGALRFNYNFCDWKAGHRDRGGDFGFDVLYFKLTGAYHNVILSADYRFYSKDFGGPMLKYGWIGYRFDEKNQVQLGLTGVPFGIQPDRYGYDVAGRNKEINQFNGQAFYKFGENGKQRLGASAEFGQLYNLDTRKNGTHYAFAVHYELLWEQISLKAQATVYAMHPKNKDGDDDTTVSMTAYGAPYLVAAKANIYMLSAGYTFPINRKYLKKIQVYNDFGCLDKQESNFKDSFQNVTGCMLDGGPVCIYVDYAMGKNHGWLGPDWNGFGTGGESNSWHARFNVNVGYYF